MRKRMTGFLLLFMPVCLLVAQPQETRVKVLVAPDHPDWMYRTGEKVTFQVTVLRDASPVRDAVVEIETGPEKMDPSEKKILTLKEGTVRVNGGTLREPGFLRCSVKARVDGSTYNGMATAAFDPLEIRPTTEEPKDFTGFWEKARAEAAGVPLDAVVTLIPERGTEKSNVYHVNLQNVMAGTRMFGILCVPKKEGKYPALLRVPGAGARPYNGDVRMADRGIITFEIGIHGVPVNLDRSVYTGLMEGALDGYWFYNLDDRDRYYYKRVYLGCVRAVDFIFSLPEFDGETLAVTGGSQGGALSIITAALDPRVKWLAAYYPALCDLTGYLYGRAGGWPHTFDDNNASFNRKADKIETSKYYDVVNFARHVRVPGIYSWGFNDTVCPPTSMYAAYNVITAGKELVICQETGHWAYPEQVQRTDAWLLERLLGRTEKEE